MAETLLRFSKLNFRICNLSAPAHKFGFCFCDWVLCSNCVSVIRGIANSRPRTTFLFCPKLKADCWQPFRNAFREFITALGLMLPVLMLNICIIVSFFIYLCLLLFIHCVETGYLISLLHCAAAAYQLFGNPISF